MLPFKKQRNIWLGNPKLSNPDPKVIALQDQDGNIIATIAFSEDAYSPHLRLLALLRSSLGEPITLAQSHAQAYTVGMLDTFLAECFQRGWLRVKVKTVAKQNKHNPNVLDVFFELV